MHGRRPEEDLRDRLNFLSDAVFAIALTLLVLEIVLPAPPAGHYQDQQLPAALWSLWPQVLTYALTFLIVGVYWMSHQWIFARLVRADTILAWLNVVFLLCVAFLPVPSKILGQYGAFGSGVRFYALCLMLPGLMIVAMWWYATDQHRLVEPDLDAVLIRHHRERYLIAPGVFLVAIGLSYLNPRLAGASLLLAVVGVVVHELRHRRRMQHGAGDQRGRPRPSEGAPVPVE
jgi:uncharacterized membrane protein